MEGVESPAAGRPIAFDFPAGGTAARVPRRIRRRLLEARSSLPSSVEEIEAKLRDAHLRRQRFHEWLSSKARPKPRSSSWLAQAEDPGQRLEARLCAAEQKRLSLLAKAQMRLARLDEQRQVARTSVEMRFEKEREELGTRVESRVQQAEANRVRLLKARMQRNAAAQQRKARSLLQRAARENRYRECVNSAILQKRAAAEKKRMGLLEAEMRRARARVNQACRVAMSICHQRESERRRIKERLEIRYQRAKRQRLEYLKHRGSHHSSWHISMNNDGDLLSRKLARCWRRFVRLKKTTFALCEAFEMLDVNENSAKTLPFERFASLIESASAIQTVRALLQRFQTRLILSQPYSSSGLENIDHLLKHVIIPKRRSPLGKAIRIRGPAKKALSKEFSSEENNVSRYPVRVVLCAYMVLGHPNIVFSTQGENELALQESAENFVREFDLLIKITLDGPISTHSVRQSFPDVLLDNCDDHQESSQPPNRHTFRSQLAAFDKAWSSYLYRFVAWKVKDATALEEVLVRAACQLELSMMQTCKLTAEGQRRDLSNDMRAIQKQVLEDQKLLRQKVLHLSGEVGIERLEIALSDTRSKFFEAKESGRPSISSASRIPSSSTSSYSSESIKDAHENQPVEDSGRSSQVIHSLFGAGSSCSHYTAETQSVDTQSICTLSKQWSMENELLVNDIVHGGAASFTNNDINCKNGSSIKAKIKETMEKAFWDGIMESLKEDKPDYNKIVRLVEEVRNELCEMAPQSWKQEILDSIDLDILSQVLESGAQDTDYLGRILDYALVMLQKLSSPAEEDEIKKAHRKLLSELTCMAESNGKQDFSFVLATVKGLRFVLDQIQTLKKEINRTRMQMVEPIIRGSAGLEYLQKAFTDHYGPPSSAANSLPLTGQWISSLQTSFEEEWNEYVDSLSVLPTNTGLPLVANLRTGGSIPLASKEISPIVTSGQDGQPECNGEKVDVLVRLGLLKLASGIDGLTVDTVPETVKLNALRLRAIQSQLQNIIVISTSMLVFRQILLSENIASSPSDLESIVSESFRRLSELLDHISDVGIQEIAEAVVGSSSDTNLQGSKEAMTRLLTKSLQKDETVFMRVSQSIYLAMRGVMLGGSGVCGRKLADGALRRVGAGMLLNRVVKTAEGLIVMANVSTYVHGPWYRCLL